MNLGKAIKTIRIKSGIRQNEFARLINVTQGYLSQLEADKKEPSIDLLNRISQQVFIPLPILLWFSVDESDVKKGLEDSFKIMKPSIDELIYSFFLDKN